MIQSREHIVVGPIAGQVLKWQVILVKPRRILKATKAKKEMETVSRGEMVAQFKDEDLAVQFCQTWNGGG